MNLPRFTIRDLLLALTLIGVGLGCFRLSRQFLVTAEFFSFDLRYVLLQVVSFALMGAGLFAPFRLKWLGASLGAAAFFALA